MNEVGDSFDRNEDMLSLATNYFSSLITSNGVADLQFILDGVDTCIYESMNEELDRTFTYEEVCLAFKSMQPLKASSEDGLGAIFYQRFWYIVSQEVTDFCIECLQGMHSLAETNQT